MKKITHTGSGNIIDIKEHNALAEYHVTDLRQVDTLIGDVVEVADFVKRRHPYGPVIIVHGCNCFNNMGAGLAKAIAKQWPQADAIDKTTIKGDKSKLGNYSFVNIGGRIVVINLYTQYNYGRGVQLSYPALEAGLMMLVHQSNEVYDTPIYLIPKYIGCGHAGGDYELVKPIVDRVMKDQPYYLFDNK